jgi:hypothetical protein
MERILPGAIRPEQIVGKPLVVYIDGERIEIGSITRAALKDGALYFAATLGTEEK